MCETIDSKRNDRKFKMQTRHAADSQNCSTNRGLQTNLNSSTNKIQMFDCFHFSNNKEDDKRLSETITNKIHHEFNYLFSGIGCFEGKFSLQVKEGNHPCQAPPRWVSYVLQKPLTEELEWIQKQLIMVPLSTDKISQWCNSFVLVPKANGKVRLCLDLARINEALTRPIQMDPTCNDIHPKLSRVKYIMLIDPSSWYHNL